MLEVTGDDGEPDFLVGLGELCRWSGYSDQTILRLAKEGVVRRRARGRYLLRASIQRLLDRARERQEASPPPDLTTLDIGDWP